MKITAAMFDPIPLDAPPAPGTLGETSQATLELLQPFLKAGGEVEALRVKCTEVVARITEKLRSLITVDLPALDAIRDRLAVGELRGVHGDKVRADFGRALLMENGVLVEEETLTNMRRDLHTSPPAWTVRGDLILTVRNLWQPKR